MIKMNDVAKSRTAKICGPTSLKPRYPSGLGIELDLDSSLKIFEAVCKGGKN